jgi:hypothetical protein
MQRPYGTRGGLPTPTLDHVLELPRSARLAAWGTAVLAGDATIGDAVRAVSQDDEPHSVHLDVHLEPGARSPGIDLRQLFDHLAQVRVPGLRLVLPAPGDPLGLPGPPDFNALALEAGECVLTEPVTDGWAAELESHGGLVPEVTVFGSQWEPGAMVSWSLHPVRPMRVTVTAGLAEAERELRQALATATEALTRLDVARWRDDAADRVAAVRDGGLPRSALPPSAPARSVQVLVTAARVRAIVELAAEDDGAAVTGYEAQQRAQTLRELAAVSRRAMAAAVNGMLEPRPAP